MCANRTNPNSGELISWRPDAASHCNGFGGCLRPDVPLSPRSLAAALAEVEARHGRQPHLSIEVAPELAHRARVVAKDTYPGCTVREVPFADPDAWLIRWDYTPFPGTSPVAGDSAPALSHVPTGALVKELRSRCRWMLLVKREWH